MNSDVYIDGSDDGALPLGGRTWCYRRGGQTMALTVTLGEGHDACMAWYYTGRTMEEPQLALLYRSCATITHHIDMSLAGY
eukprot:SAG31_NODE_43333_length_267_cov_1.113095_1_plen_80_part_10